MIKQNKKGFTLVELVIVIAVIAILAGVLIGTFASVINRANDSANIQKTKSDEIAQKAEDIIKKIEDSGWVSWEDYEADIVEKIVKELGKPNPVDNATLIRDIVEDVVKTAIASEMADSTGVTADQVRAIIENSVGTLQYEGPTEAQVRAAVSASSDNKYGDNLTATDVKEIIDAANEKNLTAADLALAVATINFENYLTTQAAVEAIKVEIRKGNKFLSESLKATVKEAIDSKFDELKGLINGTDTDPVVLAKALNIRIRKADATTLNTVYDILEKISALGDESIETTSDTPIYFNLENRTFFVTDGTEAGRSYNVPSDFGTTSENTSERYKYWVFKNVVDETYSTYLLDYAGGAISDLKTGLDVGENTIESISYVGNGVAQKVVIRTNSAATTLTINAPHDTVKHYDNLGKLVLTDIAYDCYYEYGKTAYAEATKGKIVAKEGGEVAVLYATEAAVAAVQDGGTIGNAYCVSTSAVEAEDTGYTNFSNSKDGNVTFTYVDENGDPLDNTGIKNLADEAIDELAGDEVAEDPNAAKYVARIGTKGYESFKDAVDAAKEKEVIVLLKDFTISESIGEINLDQEKIIGGINNEVRLSKDITITLSGENTEIVFDVNGKFVLGVYKLSFLATENGNAIEFLPGGDDYYTIDGSKIVFSRDFGYYYANSPLWNKLVFKASEESWGWAEQQSFGATGEGAQGGIPVNPPIPFPMP